MPRYAQNLVGQRFERLIVRVRLPNAQNGDAQWDCICDCGNTMVARSSNLLRGHTQSCGCLHRERATFRSNTHHMSKHRTYHSWLGMIQRCTNKNSPAFKWYGARGISVDPRWLKFPDFLADMGPCPENMSIDRINNNAGYSPQNCRWATKSEQAKNTRAVTLLTHNGLTLCQADWARHTGIPQPTISRRLRRGWSLERVLSP